MLAAFILNNGRMYHMAHSLALMEYLLALHFRPSLKSFPYISFIGKSYGPSLKLPVLCMRVRRHYCSVPWTGYAIRSYDQGRLQLFTCGGFPKTYRTPTGDGWCLRVSGLLLPIFVSFSIRHVDGQDTHPTLASFIGP